MLRPRMRLKLACPLVGLLLTAGSTDARIGAEWQQESPSERVRAREALRRVELDWAGITDSAPALMDSSIRVESLTVPEIRVLLQYDPESLGPMAIGRPNRGALFNGVQLEDTERLRVVDPRYAWGTVETIAALTRAVDAVHTEFPEAPPLHVGHISSPRGGWLKPHRSHQSGRDADIGYYYLSGPDWYVRATSSNLDVAKTWILIKELIVREGVEYIVIDRTIQDLIRPYAETTGEDPLWLERIFEGTHREPKVVRHAWGHLTHMHVRFQSPEAEATGARAYSELVRARLIGARRYY